MKRALFFTSALLVVTLASALGIAAPKRVAIDGTCTGCRASMPAGPEPAPLLVVLHGDWGHGPAELVQTWERHAASRGVGVLALACPKDLGCKGSWWRWDGETSFVVDQVAALRAKRELDDRRIWLAGWSGGATYIGLRSQELEKKFAAFVFHGGGYPPGAQGCAEIKAPTYFLTGDKNPLHAHVGLLRDHYNGCGNEVVWNVVKGADHDAEWKALDANGGANLDWLLAKKMQEPKPVVAKSAGNPETATTSAGGSPPTSASPPTSVEPRPTATVPPRSGCGCEAVGTPATNGLGLAIFAALPLLRRPLLRRREQRVRR